MTSHEPNLISLHEAAKSFVTPNVSIHDAEVTLANAIEHGQLHANIKRWATEQWEGKQLPGNLNRLETYIEQAELIRWTRQQQPITAD